MSNTPVYSNSMSWLVSLSGFAAPSSRNSAAVPSILSLTCTAASPQRARELAGQFAYAKGCADADASPGGLGPAAAVFLSVGQGVPDSSRLVIAASGVTPAGVTLPLRQSPSYRAQDRDRSIEGQTSFSAPTVVDIRHR